MNRSLLSIKTLILLSLAIGFSPLGAVAETDSLTLKDKNLQLRCQEKANAAVDCSIQTTKTKVIDIFRISDPARLVIDLEPEGRKNSRTVRSEALPLVAGVRTGWHTDKFRIVLDLQNEDDIEYTWQHTKQGIALALHNPSLGSEQKQPLKPAQEADLESPLAKLKEDNEEVDTKDLQRSAPTVGTIDVVALDSESHMCSADAGFQCPQPEPNKLAEDDTIIAAKNNSSNQSLKLVRAKPQEIQSLSAADSPETEEQAAASQETIVSVKNDLKTERTVEAKGSSEDTAIAEKEMASDTVRARLAPSAPAPESLQSTEQVLSKIFFTVGAGPNNDAVQLRLSQKPSFNLARVGTRKYRLRIADATLQSEALSLPFFPPHTFPGISFIQAKEDNNRLEVMIGVERGTKLRATQVAEGIALSVIE